MNYFSKTKVLFISTPLRQKKKCRSQRLSGSIFMQLAFLSSLFVFICVVCAFLWCFFVVSCVASFEGPRCVPPPPVLPVPPCARCQPPCWWRRAPPSHRPASWRRRHPASWRRPHPRPSRSPFRAATRTPRCGGGSTGGGSVVYVLVGFLFRACL